jgi:hypothetical protein
LFPAGGGDGSAGFVLAGIGQYDLSGWSVRGAGDVHGDGIAFWPVCSGRGLWVEDQTDTLVW